MEGALVWHRRLGPVEIVGVTDDEVWLRTQHADQIRVSAASILRVLSPQEPPRGRAGRTRAPWQRRDRPVERPKVSPRGLENEPFCAIDFETANTSRDSACAVAIIRVEEGEVVARATRLIRPPPGEFLFSWLHGITERDVAGKPQFADVWMELKPLTDGIKYFAAHNAGFDQSVLWNSCLRFDLPTPMTPFACTVRLAREVWDIRPTALPDVCSRLEIPLIHHDPSSDAEAVASILWHSARCT